MPQDQGRVDPAEALMREVGAQLREVRLERGENLEEVAEYLRIKPTYLYGIEQGDLSVMPGRTYALGFLRSYADYLGFDGDDLIVQIKWTVDNLTGRPRLQIRTPLPESRLPKMPVVVLSLAVLAGTYAGWSYINRSSDLMVETVAEVPDTLRRMAAEALPATGAPAGTGAPGTTGNEGAPPPAVGLGEQAPPITTSDLPGERSERPSTGPQLQPSGVAALPPRDGAAQDQPQSAPDEAAPAIAEPAPSIARSPAVARNEAAPDFEILPSTTPLTGADAARDLPAEMPPVREVPVREPTERPTRTALASDLVDAARANAARARAAPAPEAGPEDAAPVGEPPTLRTAALVPGGVPADAAADAEPGAELSDRAVVPARAAPMPGPEQAVDGTSAAAVVAALTGRTSLEEGPGADGAGPQVLETVNADARVILRANDSSWLQITSDSGDYLRSRTLDAGDLILVPNRPDLQLWTGNAGGLDVFVDGEEVAPLGPVGSVVRDVSLDPESLKVRW